MILNRKVTSHVIEVGSPWRVGLKHPDKYTHRKHVGMKHFLQYVERWSMSLKGRRLLCQSPGLSDASDVCGGQRVKLHNHVALHCSPQGLCASVKTLNSSK